MRPPRPPVLSHGARRHTACSRSAAARAPNFILTICLSLFRRSAKGQSFALRQRNTVGGGTGSIVGLVQDIGGTLLTPTQLYFVLGWLALVLKFLIFYDK